MTARTDPSFDIAHLAHRSTVRHAPPPKGRPALANVLRRKYGRGTAPRRLDHLSLPAEDASAFRRFVKTCRLSPRLSAGGVPHGARRCQRPDDPRAGLGPGALERGRPQERAGPGRWRTVGSLHGHGTPPVPQPEGE